MITNVQKTIVITKKILNFAEIKNFGLCFSFYKSG
jgi:hypothetical protein